MTAASSSSSSSSSREKTPLLLQEERHDLSASASSSSRRPNFVSPTRHHLLSFEVGFPELLDEQNATLNGAQAAQAQAEPDARLPLVFLHPKNQIQTLNQKQMLANARWTWRVVSDECVIVLTLLMTSIGSGTLAVPYTFVLLPQWLAVLVMVLTGLAMAFTAEMVVMAHVQVASKYPHEEMRVTYQELAMYAGGNVLDRLVSGSAAFGVFGACVGGICVVKDMAPSLLKVMYLSTSLSFEQLPADSQQTLVNHTVWAIFLLIMLPMGFSKQISSLRVFSYLGFVSSFYLVGVVAYRSMHHPMDESRPEQEPNAGLLAVAPLDKTVTFMKLAQSIAIYNFTFMLHLNVIPLLSHAMQRQVSRQRAAAIDGAAATATATATAAAIAIAPGSESNSVLGSPSQGHPSRLRARTTSVIGLMSDEERRELLLDASISIRRKIYLVTTLCVAFYGTFGLSAHWLYGDKTSGNILLNLQDDPIMQIPKLAVLMTILFAFPLLFHPLRVLVMEMLFGDDAKHASFPRLMLVSVVMLVTQVLCAMRVPGIHVVFSFVGSSILLLLCYVFPGIFFTRLVPWKSSHQRFRVVAVWVLALVMGCFGLAATWQVIQSTFFLGQ